MYAIVRQDLPLTAGGKAAQAGHAFLDTFLSAPPDLASAYRADGGTKVVLACDSEFALLDLNNKIKTAGYPCALMIEDDFDLPTPTALGVGPITRADAKRFLGDLKLMK